MHLGYRGDLRIRMADRPAESLPTYLDAGKSSSRMAIEREDPVQEYSTEQSFGCRKQPVAALSLAYQLNAIKELCFCDRGREQLSRRLHRCPLKYFRRTARLHQLGNDR